LFIIVIVFWNSIQRISTFTMKFIAATISLLLAEECTAQTTRLRNKDMYKSNPQRKLQPGTENIFDMPAVDEPVAIAVDTPDLPIEMLSISLSMPPITTPPVMDIPATVGAATTAAAVPEPTEAFVAEPESMSLPEAPVDLPVDLPTTISASASTASPEATLPAPLDMSMSMPTTGATEFGIPMTIPAQTTAAAGVITTDVATTPAVTTSQSATTEPTEVIDNIDMSMPMSMSEIPTTEAPFEWSPEDESSMSMPSFDFIPPIEER
jgi:hypothetical protein